MKYIKEDVIEDIRKSSEKFDDFNSERFSEDKETCTINTVYKHFDSWRDAVESAGVDGNSYDTKEELLEQIRGCYEKHGRVTAKLFKYDDDYASSSTVSRHFESWNAALREANIPINEERRIEDSEVLNRIREFKEEEDSVSMRAFQEYENSVAHCSIVRKFGSWNKAVQLAGFEPNDVGVNERFDCIEKSEEYGKGWYTMRKKVLDRDGECKVCGTEDNLHVHHIKPRREFENVTNANTFDNLITLCRKCHPKVECGKIECPEPQEVPYTLSQRVVS